MVCPLLVIAVVTLLMFPCFFLTSVPIQTNSLCDPDRIPNKQTAEPEMVFEWRAEAERCMREAGRPGMSDDEVRDFCSRYMPAYRAYLPGLYGRCRAAGTGVGESTDGDGLGHHPPGDGRREDIVQESLDGNRMLTGGVGRARQTLVIEVGRDRNPVV